MGEGSKNHLITKGIRQMDPKTLLSPLGKDCTTFPEIRQTLPGQYQKRFICSRQRLQKH